MKLTKITSKRHNSHRFNHFWVRRQPFRPQISSKLVHKPSKKHQPESMPSPKPNGDSLKTLLISTGSSHQVLTIINRPLFRIVYIRWWLRWSIAPMDIFSLLPYKCASNRCITNVTKHKMQQRAPYENRLLFENTDMFYNINY